MLEVNERKLSFGSCDPHDDVGECVGQKKAILRCAIVHVPVITSLCVKRFFPFRLSLNVKCQRQMPLRHRRVKTAAKGTPGTSARRCELPRNGRVSSVHHGDDDDNPKELSQQQRQRSPQITSIGVSA
mmetsp:Transcript_24834/g.36393  ORF Transcript_24834/g.36393 Transcript_24834/m.36393 type:complete len:128 (-) Transcript_24834:169-552(-)